MADEFEESEVIFSEDAAARTRDYKHWMLPEEVRELRNNRSRRRKRKKKINHSAPVSIPENVPRNSWFQYVESDFFEEGEGGGGPEGDMVPPHVMLGQRIAGKMAFSVCTGYGRTLKGRDLSELRNSVLRLTGFLET